MTGGFAPGHGDLAVRIDDAAPPVRARLSA